MKALDGLACTGRELYRQREEHVLREPWSKAPAIRPAVPKPSRNTARRLRARCQKNLEPSGVQAQGLERPNEVVDSEGGFIEAKGSEPSRRTSTQPSAEVDEKPPGSLMTVIVKMIAHHDGMGLRVGGQLLKKKQKKH